MDYSKLYKYQQDHQEPEKNEEIISEEAEIEDGQTLKVGKYRLVVLVLIIVGSLLIILYVANVIAVKSYLKEEVKLEKQLENYENRNHLLIKKINELESPERITKIAQERLGMIKPDVPPKILPKK